MRKAHAATLVAALAVLPAGADDLPPALDPGSGLVVDTGFETVRAVCTGCHSAKLVTQNRATREGWREMIRWMQRTQGLPLFPADMEAEILGYLGANYAPARRVFRRAPLPIEARPPEGRSPRETP